MCTCFFSFRSSPGIELCVAFNRDEFFKRATKPLHFWDQTYNVLAGRDLRKGGTWFGVGKHGRMACLTSFRDPHQYRKEARTRGEIVVKFLEGSMSATDFTADALLNSKHYNHYNLLCYDGNEIVYGSTSKQILRPLTPGCYGLSNDDLDHHWPKVRFGLPIFTRVLGADQPRRLLDLFTLMQHSGVYADELLPHTGIGLEQERALSAIFVTPEAQFQYGTRSTSVLTLFSNGRVEFFERSYSMQDRAFQLNKIQFMRQLKA